MLRNLVEATKSVYTCTCLVRTGTHGLKPKVSAIAERWFQTSSMLPVLHKELRGKKTLVKMSREMKQEQSSLTDKASIAVSEEFNIPTMETMSMLINGTRFDELPIVHIHSSENNTIMLLTDYKGQTRLARTSCGGEGFRNSKKSNMIAAQATGLSMGYRASKQGVEYVRAVVKGIGRGRLPALKGMQMAGVKIVSITDKTHLPVNEGRARKARRL